MHQREARALPQVCTHLLIQLVIGEQPIQFFEHGIRLGCHFWHPREHILHGVMIDQHRRVSLHFFSSAALILPPFPLFFQATTFLSAMFGLSSRFTGSISQGIRGLGNRDPYLVPCTSHSLPLVTAMTIEPISISNRQSSECSKAGGWS